MLTRQLFNLDTAKRPADRDVGADRAAKRSKTVPDAATIRAVQERINSIEADQLNSDNNFVGAFDDEDIRSDEHEDEIDLDIVVGAIWFLFTRSSTLSLSLDSPVVQRPCPCDPTACDQTPTRRCSRGSMSFFFHLITPTTISQICQTPIWNQPEPDLPAPDNTEGNISDDDNEGELTIHEREHHKLRWPPKTRLVHPARGRWSGSRTAPLRPPYKTRSHWLNTTSPLSMPSHTSKKRSRWGAMSYTRLRREGGLVLLQTAYPAIGGTASGCPRW